MIGNIAVAVTTEPAKDVGLRQALDLAERLSARVLLIVPAPLEREEVAAELPGMEADPVERVLSEEPGWPDAEGEMGRLPDIAVRAAETCRTRRIAHEIMVVHGRLPARLRDISRLADLLVLCCPGRPLTVTARQVMWLARRAACSCMLTAGEVGPIRLILSLYDGSVGGARRLRYVCALAAGLNARVTITVTGRSRAGVEQLMDEARIVALGYHVEHKIDALVGMSVAELPSLAQDAGAELVAGPPSRAFISSAIALSSMHVLVGQ